MDSFVLVQSSVELRNKHLMYCADFLDKHPIYGQSSKVYIVENLPSANGGLVAHAFKDRPYSCTMAEVGSPPRPGVGKTHQSTIDMTLKFKNALFEDRIAFASDMGTFTEYEITGAPTSESRRPEEMKELLLSQLAAVRYDPETRKINAKGGGKTRDDLSVSSQMPIHHAHTFLYSPQYAPFRNEAYSRRISF